MITNERTVELRVLQSGGLIVNGLPLLRGMRHRASPVEAAYLQAAGVCERMNGAPSASHRSKREHAAVVR